MATWAIGDIHGCFGTLERLLARIDWTPGRDRLWLTGDLVNRGPRSLDVLRWAIAQGAHLTAVLGNHDLHLLALAEGVGKPRPRDTLDEVLGAYDRVALLRWLAARPLAHREGDYLLVHAGLLPQWSARAACETARDLSKALAGKGRAALLATLRLRGLPAPGTTEGNLERLALELAALTRMRTIAPDGTLDLDYKGPPADAPPGHRPWFELRADAEPTVVCGHWSALGLHVRPGLVALDAGCYLRRELAAYRLDDGTLVREPYAEGD